MSFTPFLILLAELLAEPGIESVPAVGDRYFITIFGSQSVPYRGRYTHTWATFIKTNGDRPVDVQTISWMPATLHIRLLALRPEPGVNLSLAQTYDWIASYNGRVSVWGPYEISAERYGRYMSRKADLDGGEVAYRAIGTLTRDPGVSNCGQSFSLASRRMRQSYVEPTPSPGENGTSKLVERYIRVGALDDPTRTHEWLLPLIGANAYPTTHRQPGERVPFFRR